MTDTAAIQCARNYRASKEVNAAGATGREGVVSHPRFIILWRKPAPDYLDWEHYTTQFRTEIESAVRNLEAQGVRQWHVYELGAHIPELSQDVMGVRNTERPKP